jgi:hypothetical protein
MSVMKQGGAAIGGGRARWQRVLLVSELAFVVTLLVATALFVTSFVNVLRADLGFARQRLAGVGVSRSLGSVEDVAARPPVAEAFVNDALTRARAVPGVEGAAFVHGNLPLFGGVVRYGVEIDVPVGRPAPAQLVPQIPVRLAREPELRRRAEVGGESESRVGADAARVLYDLVEAVGRHAEAARDRRLRSAQILDEVSQHGTR